MRSLTERSELESCWRRSLVLLWWLDEVSDGWTGLTGLTRVDLLCFLGMKELERVSEGRLYGRWEMLGCLRGACGAAGGVRSGG